MGIFKVQQWLQPQKVLNSNKAISRKVVQSVPLVSLERPDEQIVGVVQETLVSLKLSKGEHRCAYCNHLMIPQHEMTFITENLPNVNGSSIFEVLNTYINLLEQRTKKIAIYIQKICKKMPDSNFWTIFDAATNNLTILQKLKELTLAIPTLKPSEKKSLQKFFNQSQKRLFSGSQDNSPFDRGIFLAKFNEILNSFKHQDRFDNLREYEDSLPDLSTYMNIFFNKNNRKRDSKAIFNHLFLNSLETEEHLGEKVHYPEHKLNPFNLILVCCQCNHKRDSKPFQSFIETNSKVVPILKSYIKSLLYSENPNIRLYATGVAKNIERLSGGKISFFNKSI